MTVEPTRSRPAAATALRWGQHVLFGLLYVIAAAQVVAGDVPGTFEVTAAGFALWYVAGAWVAGRREDPRVGWGWFAVLSVLWLVTVVHAPSFAWLVFALNLIALHLLPTTWGVLTVVVLTCVSVLVLLPAASNPVAAVLGPTMGALVAVGIVAGYRMILRESAERGRLVTELTAAQNDLVAVQDELATAQREQGVLAERARLARDIHDTLAQGYSSILLLARAGLARGGADPDLLAQVEATAQENLVEARRVVHALAPAQLEDAPLPAAVRRLLTRLQAETDLVAELEVSGDPRLSSTAVDVAVLRLVQGALANVRQHAGASRVVVSFSYEPGELLVDVVDDGRGFDPAGLPSGVRPDASGFGLRAMRERMESVGGTLAVESEPGQGTAVAASLPLRGGRA